MTALLNCVGIEHLTSLCLSSICR